MATAIEYGMLVALIGVASIGATEATGGKVKQTFCSVAESFGTAGNCDSESEATLFADPYKPGVNGWPEWPLTYGDANGNACAYRYNYNTKAYDLSATTSGSCGSHMAGNEFSPGVSNNLTYLWPPNYPGTTWKPRT